jgi:hypothetical protein
MSITTKQTLTVSTATSHADNYDGVNTDDFHDANVSANRCLRGGVGLLHMAAAQARQIEHILGDKFHDFARTRLGLAPMMTDFLLRVAEMGINPAQFSPDIEVKLAAVIGMMTQIVDTWAAVTVGTTPAATGMLSAPRPRTGDDAGEARHTTRQCDVFVDDPTSDHV